MDYGRVSFYREVVELPAFSGPEMFTPPQGLSLGNPLHFSPKHTFKSHSTFSTDWYMILHQTRIKNVLRIKEVTHHAMLVDFSKFKSELYLPIHFFLLKVFIKCYFYIIYRRELSMFKKKPANWLVTDSQLSNFSEIP